MKMKRMMMAMMMALTTVTTALADDFAYLTVSGTDGSTSYEVQNITKLTFEGSNLIVWNGDSRMAELPLATLEKMFFSSTANGLTTLGAAQSTIQMTEGTLKVKASKGSRISIYNIGGAVVKEVTASAEETEVNLSGLRKGVYIVKVGQETKKVMNK